MSSQSLDSELRWKHGLLFSFVAFVLFVVRFESFVRFEHGFEVLMEPRKARKHEVG